MRLMDFLLYFLLGVVGSDAKVFRKIPSPVVRHRQKTRGLTTENNVETSNLDYDTWSEGNSRNESHRTSASSSPEEDCFHSQSPTSFSYPVRPPSQGDGYGKGGKGYGKGGKGYGKGGKSHLCPPSNSPSISSNPSISIFPSSPPSISSQPSISTSPSNQPSVSSQPSLSSSPSSVPSLSSHRSVSEGYRNRRLRGSSSHNSTVVMKSEIDRHPVIEKLRNVTTRFYIYKDCDIILCNERRKLRKQGRASNIDHIVGDSQAEAEIVEHLSSHPLRTWNPEEASLFVVPMPISEILAYGCQFDDCDLFERAFRNLASHPIFRKHGGHNHLLIVQSWVTFNPRFITTFPAMLPVFKIIENVTVAFHYDPLGCKELAEQPELLLGTGYSALFEWESRHMVNAFSIGLAGTSTYPIQPVADVATFLEKKIFVFYHSREGTMAFGSKKYRMALLTNTTQLYELPPSSIGYDIPADVWLDHMYSSKFCLSIRGDTPHSHALLRALRAGCVPVVVSDHYEAYAPTFKTLFKIEDWAIFIKESDFIASPTQALNALQSLPSSYIKEKLANMSMAQLVVLPDSRYFVPALISEALSTTVQVLSQESRSVKRMDSEVIIRGNVTELFYFPSSLIGHFDLNHEAPVIVGVVSEASHCIRRQVIRESWGQGYRVFFLLSGDWEDVEDEFYTFGDVLWIGLPGNEKRASARHASMSADVFIWAVVNYVGSYSYILKTRDDSYVEMDRIERILHEHRPDYWGACTRREIENGEYWPHFALDIGYALSRRLSHCIMTKISNKTSNNATAFYPQKEELFISALAKECGVSCSDVEWHWKDYWMTPIKKATSGQDFAVLNDQILWRKHASPYYEALAMELEEAMEVSLTSVNAAEG